MKLHLFLFTTTLLLIAACGIKGPPKPPEPVVPDPPENLRAVGRESCVELRWKPSEIPPEGGHMVGRAAVDPDHPSLYVFNEREKLGPETNGFTDCELEPGRIYIYRVSALNRDGLSGEPVISGKVINVPAPPAPVALEARPGDRFVDLFWEMPEGTDTEVGFHVYRANQPDGFLPRPVNSSPITEMTWSDGGLKNDRPYWYQVRALALVEGLPAMEGRGSEIIEVVPRDRIAPVAPGDLSALPVEQGVLLRWSSNAETDLAGYNIYRKIEGKGGFQRINEETVKETEFTDRALPPPGSSLSYCITAVDNASEPNERKRSAIEKVFIPRR